MRRATPNDIPLLVGLMRDFYAEAGFDLDDDRAASAFGAVLSDERLGYVWIIQGSAEDVQDNAEDVGHVVVVTRYAMEYGGFIGCLDDLYVRPAWRNKGLSTSALAEVRGFCESVGIRAMTVEVGDDNGPAQAVYSRAGFAHHADRQLLALQLADAAHRT